MHDKPCQCSYECASRVPIVQRSLGDAIVISAKHWTTLGQHEPYRYPSRSHRALLMASVTSLPPLTLLALSRPTYPLQLEPLIAMSSFLRPYDNAVVCHSLLTQGLYERSLSPPPQPLEAEVRDARDESQPVRGGSSSSAKSPSD